MSSLIQINFQNFSNVNMWALPRVIALHGSGGGTATANVAIASAGDDDPMSICEDEMDVDPPEDQDDGMEIDDPDSMEVDEW